jgi:hypothetical protein
MTKREMIAGGAGYDRYFLLFDLCCALFAAWLALEVAGFDNGWVVALEVFWTLLLLALFSRKRRDEFAEHCWRTATTATFVMLLIVPILWSVADGFIAGINDLPAVEDYEPPMDGVLAILFAAFFGSFQWTRFRGTA